MSRGDEAAVKKTMEEIEAYLQQRRNAADTLEGIRLCWLKQGAQRSVEHVHEAVQRLLDEGRIKEEELWDGERVYRAVQSRPLH